MKMKPRGPHTRLQVHCRMHPGSAGLFGGTGKPWFFCATCGTGVIEERPASTEHFYGDGYYGGATANGWAAGCRYEDYSLTAEHTLLWARLFVECCGPRAAAFLTLAVRMASYYAAFEAALSVLVSRSTLPLLLAAESALSRLTLPIPG
jgi:hypothetical protein